MPRSNELENHTVTVGSCAGPGAWARPAGEEGSWLPHFLLSLTFQFILSSLCHPFFLSFMHSVQALVETDLSTYFNLPLSCVVGEYCVTMVLNLTESQLSHLWNGDNTSITPFLPPKRLCLCLSCPILPSTALATQGGRQNPHIQEWDSNGPVNNGHPDHLNN